MERSNELTAIMEHIDDGLRKLIVMEGIYTDYTQNRITPEQVMYVNFAIESIMATNDTPITRGILVAEHLGDRILVGIKTFFSNLHTSILKYVDYLHYVNTFFNVQSGHIAQIRRDLMHTSSGIKEARIRVGANKYMMHGINKVTVSSMEEYLAQFNLMVDTLTPYIDSTVTLTKEDLFSGLKFWKDYLFNEPDDFIGGQFDALEKHLTAAKRGLPSSPSIQNPVFQEFRSPYLLGMAQVLVRLPRPNTYKKNDLNSVIDASRHLYMCTDRKMKVTFGSVFAGSIPLVVTKKDIETILDKSEKLLSAADGLLQMTARLSNVGALADSNIIQHRSLENKEDAGFMLQGMRIYMRTCSVIYDSVSTGYTFSLSNIKQGLSIAEKAVKHM